MPGLCHFQLWLWLWAVAVAVPVPALAVVVGCGCGYSSGRRGSQVEALRQQGANGQGGVACFVCGEAGVQDGEGTRAPEAATSVACGTRASWLHILCVEPLLYASM